VSFYLECRQSWKGEWHSDIWRKGCRGQKKVGNHWVKQIWLCRDEM